MNEKKEKWRSFEEVKECIRGKFKNMKEYKKWKDRPKDIPSHPEIVYKNRGWKGWNDFLGYEEKAWSIRKVKELLKAWIESGMIYEEDEIVLYDLLYTKGLLNVQGRHEQFFKNLINASRTSEGRKALEEYVNSDSDIPPEFEEDEEIGTASIQEIADLVENETDPLDYGKIKPVEQILKQSERLDSYVEDIENMQFYVSKRIKDLWSSAFRDKDPENTVLKVKAKGKNGNKYHDAVIETFLSDYQGACKISLLSARDVVFCIFHDINYLKDENYEKHKEEVAKRFEKKLSDYSSNHRPFEFIGYYLPEISFQNKQFSEALYLNDATFYGIANFGRATFSKQAYFSGAIFSNEANFSIGKFSELANFNRANFAENVSFLNTWFHGEANFLAVDFKKLADFVYCKFKKRANFSQVYFYGEAWLGATDFSDLADFSDTFFDNNVYFIQSHFERKANFSNVIFREKALTNFSHSTFDRDADFSNAEFNNRVDFSSAHFLSNSSFCFTKFQEARFASTKFETEPIFLGACLIFFHYGCARTNFCC